MYKLYSYAKIFGSTGDELIYKKDLIIDRFCCDGLELHKFTYGPQDLRFLRDEGTDMSIQGKHFISHSNPNIKVNF